VTEQTGPGLPLAMPQLSPRGTTAGTWLATFVFAAVGGGVFWLLFLAPEPNPVSYGPTEHGELEVIRVISGMQTDPGGIYDHEVRLPDGRVAVAEFREVLPRGEHLQATFAVASGGRLLRLHAFVRCGTTPCGKRR
jgi:hypothetical protein